MDMNFEYKKEQEEWNKKYDRLTVKMIKEKYWNPVTKKGKPIVCFNCQDFDKDPEWKTKTPTGVLIKGIGQRRKKEKDWLSKSTDGPYDDKGTNSNIFYFLEFEETDGGTNIEQIAWNNDDPSLPNNYLSSDALDGVDYWVKKQ